MACSHDRRQFCHLRAAQRNRDSVGCILPILQRICHADGTGQAVLLWQVDGGTRTLTRVQVPLAQAWALTIHKCQGGDESGQKAEAAEQLLLKQNICAFEAELIMRVMLLGGPHDMTCVTAYACIMTIHHGSVL